MGREVRRVPADWVHPRRQDGTYVPMYDSFPYSDVEVEEGLEDGWLDSSKPNYGLDVMPQWNDSEKTHMQMYENTTEGTPISPVMETAEELARWLADNKASAFGSMTATYEQWLVVCKLGSAPSFVIDSGIVKSGVADLADCTK